MNYILDDGRIENVLFNHKFTLALFGEDLIAFPEANIKTSIETDEVVRIRENIDKLIFRFAEVKKCLCFLSFSIIAPKHTPPNGSGFEK